MDALGCIGGNGCGNYFVPGNFEGASKDLAGLGVEFGVCKVEEVSGAVFFVVGAIRVNNANFWVIVVQGFGYKIVLETTMDFWDYEYSTDGSFSI